MANEKRLIDANALVSYLWTLYKFFGSIPCSEADKATQRGIRRCIGEIKKMPTVDAVEVVHGRWIPHYEIFDSDPSVGVSGGEYQTGWQCSVCGRYEPSEEPYCNCGAKMDGGNENG